jgi:aminocarboxymuconate-semialdehyde decarboxylase
MVIDVHTHIVPEHFPAMGGRVAGDAWPYMDHIAPGEANVVISGRNFRTVVDRCWSVPRRLAEMPGEGVDQQVLSPMPELLAYALSPTDCLELGRHLNETIARMISESPDKFFGLGAVPLQDPDLAAKELSRVKSMGLQGVEVLSNVNGENLGDAKYRGFFKEVERLGLAVFVHSQHPTFENRFVGPAMLENVIGFPIESGLAAASVITGGLLQACPDLRICFSHGGGVFGQLLPRMEHVWNERPPMREGLPEAPSVYAKKLYYDDVFFETRTLRYLLDMVGVSQVMVGSDYPFFMRHMTPAKEFEELGLSPEDAEAIASGNCLRFLGVS